MVGTMAVPSYNDNEVGPATIGNARTRGVNPSMQELALSLNLMTLDPQAFL